MAGPSERQRDSIRRVVGTVETESALEGVLADIRGMAANDLEWANERSNEPLTEQEAEDLLADVEAWAGLASYVIVDFYTGFEFDDNAVGADFFRKLTRSPFKLAPGWDKSIVKRLQEIVNVLRRAMELVCKTLRAASFSIGVGFPWGVSVSLAWG
jgi:hypothetical protein